MFLSWTCGGRPAHYLSPRSAQAGVQKSTPSARNKQLTNLLTLRADTRRKLDGQALAATLRGRKMLVRDVVRAEPRMRPSAVCALPQKRAAEDSPIARATRHVIQQRRDGGARVVDGLAGERVWGRTSPAPPAPVQPSTRLSVAGKKEVSWTRSWRRPRLLPRGRKVCSCSNPRGRPKWRRRRG